MDERAGYRKSWSCRTLLATAALFFLPVVFGGCAAAGMAAVSPVLSAIEAIADRSVERTLPADLPAASSVTLDTVSRLGFKVHDLQRADDTWTFEAANEKLTVHGQLTRFSPSLTRVSLRVEIGSFAADKSTADEILNQIAGALAEQQRVKAPGATESVGSTRLAEIEAELQRLRIELEAARARAERRVERSEVDARDAAGTSRVPGVISIPASYGVPTIAAPSALDAPRSDRGGAGLLAPVNGLRPVQPVTTTETVGK
jgi:hypothetical protein